MIPAIDILRVFQLAIAILGALIVYYTGKGYLRTSKKSLLFLAVGFAIVTVGVLVAGTLFGLLKSDIISAEIVVAGSEVLGFALIVYSIVGTKD